MASRVVLPSLRRLAMWSRVSGWQRAGDDHVVQRCVELAVAALVEWRVPAAVVAAMLEIDHSGAVGASLGPHARHRADRAESDPA